jgi:hypothetical protein
MFWPAGITIERRKPSSNHRLRILAEYQLLRGIVICAASWSPAVLSLRALEVSLTVRGAAGALARKTANALATDSSPRRLWTTRRRLIVDD